MEAARFERTVRTESSEIFAIYGGARRVGRVDLHYGRFEVNATLLLEVDLTDERGRQPLQLQLIFAAHADPAKLGELLATWEARALETERHCAAILGKRGIDTTRLRRLTLDRSPNTTTVNTMPRDSGALQGLDARGMTALFGLRRAQADLAWLEEVRSVLAETELHRTGRPE